jgi:hypothetical protein
MPGIAVFACTTLPPSEAIRSSATSISSTSTVMIGCESSLVRSNMPPLIAPGSRGCWVCSSTGVVSTFVYCISGRTSSRQSKAAP